MPLSTRIQLCGEFHATIEGRDVTRCIREGQERALLAYLCLHRDHPIPRHELIDALWSSPPDSAERGLSVLLSRLRATLGSSVIEGRSSARLVLGPDAHIDVEVARVAIHQAEALVRYQDWIKAWINARIARNISRRRLLPTTDMQWVQIERRRMHVIMCRALESIAEIGLGMGGAELDSSLRAAYELMEIERFRESAYRLAMRAHVSRGNPSEALFIYSQLREMLREHLGADPGPESQSLYFQTLR